MNRILFAASIGAVAVSCGGGPSEAPSAGESVPLMIVDSIGVEMGDSNYVFGSITSIEFGPDGLLYVLDRAACNVRVFSREGELVRVISREGGGPGELMSPFAMAVLGDGRISVCSPFNGGIQQFLPEGTWEGLSAEFTNNPPLMMEGADSNAYVALKLDVTPPSEGGQEITVGVRICRYEESNEPAVVYYQNSFPFDPLNLTMILRESFFGYTFDARRDGMVAMARRSSEAYEVRLFDASGNPLGTLTRDLPVVPKSEEEILDEKTFVEGMMQSMGASGVAIDYDPDPDRDQVIGGFFDGEDRVWVQRGSTDGAVFDVWSTDGSLLSAAGIAGAGTEGRDWDFEAGSGAIYTDSPDPELYQQIFVIPMP